MGGMGNMGGMPDMGNMSGMGDMGGFNPQAFAAAFGGNMPDMNMVAAMAQMFAMQQNQQGVRRATSFMCEG